MSKKTVTVEELNSALEYLNNFSKGKPSEPVAGDGKEGEQKPEGDGDTSEQDGDAEPEDELYAAHKKKMAAYLDKAMSHKEYMDAIKKGGPLPDEAFDDLDDEESAPAPKQESEKPAEGEQKSEGEQNQGGEVKKGLETETLDKANLDELVKAKVAEELEGVKSDYEEIIKGQKEMIANLEEKINKIADEPMRKTLIKGADAITLKAAISGEKIDDKTVLSVSLQKSKVSEALYNAYETENDSIRKGILGDAVSQFECTGNYISSEVVDIMESKGFRFIK